MGQATLQVYEVKLSFWCTPLKVEADSEAEAKEKALKQFPTCDCCDEITTVDWVKPV